MAVKNLELEAKWKRSAYDAAKSLAGMIKVEQEPNADIVSLSAWSDRAEEAVAIANGVRDAFEQRRREAETERFRRLSATVNSEIAKQAAAVDEKRRAMHELQKKHNIVDLAPLIDSPAIEHPAEVPEAANPSDFAEIEQTSEAPLESDPAADAAAQQKLSENAAGRARYESQLSLLQTMRELAARQTEAAAGRNLIDIIEPAVAVEDR